MSNPIIPEPNGVEPIDDNPKITLNKKTPKAKAPPKERVPKAKAPPKERVPKAKVPKEKVPKEKVSLNTENEKVEPANVDLFFTNKRGLEYSFTKDPAIIEIGLDEVGRGCLFGRAYIGAVVLPDPATITTEQLVLFHEIRDSKKITSRAKMDKLAEFIRNTCPFWSVQYQESTEVDTLNIKQAVLVAMSNGVVHILDNVLDQDQDQDNPKSRKVHILADGIEFTQFQYITPRVPLYSTEPDRSPNGSSQSMTNDGSPSTNFPKKNELDNSPTEQNPFTISVQSIDKGDNKFIAIACASILAKSTRDTYITDLCTANPELAEKYGLHTNMGYGTAVHMAGIEQWGVTDQHRRSFAPVAQRLGLSTPKFKPGNCLV
jgi:ribonuclease HII